MHMLSRDISSIGKIDNVKINKIKYYDFITMEILI